MNHFSYIKSCKRVSDVFRARRLDAKSPDRKKKKKRSTAEHLRAYTRNGITAGFCGVSKRRSPPLVDFESAPPVCCDRRESSCGGKRREIAFGTRTRPFPATAIPSQLHSIRSYRAKPTKLLWRTAGRCRGQTKLNNNYNSTATNGPLYIQIERLLLLFCRRVRSSLSINGEKIYII